MGSVKLVGIGLFIMFTLPALVAASDRRHTHDLFHAALALAGLALALATGGTHALLLAIVSGGLVLLLLTATVALTQRQWQRRPLTGGEIKFLAAAATWLMPSEAMLALIGAFLAMILWSWGKKSISGHVDRPDIVPFIIMATIFSAALRNG